MAAKHDEGRARCGAIRRTDRPGLHRSKASTAAMFSMRCSSATRSCTTCSLASTRPSWAARRSRLPCPAPCTAGQDDLDLAHQQGRAGSMCCPASPVMSAPMPPPSTLAEGPHRQDEIMLVVDVGTNAEIVLGNSERGRAASSPTGPAFEGAEISPAASAQRPAPSSACASIPRRHWNRAFRVIGSELWSDEPGIRRAASRRPASPASAVRPSSR